MCGFYFHLHSQILHNFYFVFHSTSTSFLFRFRLGLITEFEIYGIFRTLSHVSTQYIFPFAVKRLTLI